MSRTRAERDVAKWDRCRRCRHYRVEHGPAEKRCTAADVSTVDPDILNRCDCPAFTS